MIESLVGVIVVILLCDDLVMQNPLEAKELLKNEQHEIFPPDWLIPKFTESSSRTIQNSRRLRGIARDKTELDDKQLNKELAEKTDESIFFYRWSIVSWIQDKFR